MTRSERIAACPTCKGRAYTFAPDEPAKMCSGCGENCHHWPKECGSPALCRCKCDDCKAAFNAYVNLLNDHRDAANIGH